MCVAFSTTPGYATVGISRLNDIFFLFNIAKIFDLMIRIIITALGQEKGNPEVNTNKHKNIMDSFMGCPSYCRKTIYNAFD